MSVADDGTRSNGDSNWPALSADGRYVVFESEATNLVGVDTNGTPDVFVKDRSPPLANERARAEAGGDAIAPGGATVLLDARASRDPDGSIIAYLWQQTAGTPVGLSDANGATASFIAPTLPTPKDLSLTVVDNRGAGATDAVVIRVEPQASCPADTTAPRTRYQRKRTRVDGVPAYTVTLTPNEPASVHFRVKGVGRIVRGARPISDWQPYSHPYRKAGALRAGPGHVLRRRRDGKRRKHPKQDLKETQMSHGMIRFIATLFPRVLEPFGPGRRGSHLLSQLRPRLAHRRDRSRRPRGVAQVVWTLRPAHRPSSHERARLHRKVLGARPRDPELRRPLVRPSDRPLPRHRPRRVRPPEPAELQPLCVCQ